VSENRIVRRIFGPMKEEVVGGWKRQHNEEFHNLYASTNIIRAIKSRMMGGVCSTNGRYKNVYSENLKGRGRLQDLGLGGKIISEQTSCGLL
jgi:hypothetical protein